MFLALDAALWRTILFVLSCLSLYCSSISHTPLFFGKYTHMVQYNDTVWSYFLEVDGLHAREGRWEERSQREKETAGGRKGHPASGPAINYKTTVGCLDSARGGIRNKGTKRCWERRQHKEGRKGVKDRRLVRVETRAERRWQGRRQHRKEKEAKAVISSRGWWFYWVL